MGGDSDAGILVIDPNNARDDSLEKRLNEELFQVGTKVFSEGDYPTRSEIQKAQAIILFPAPNIENYYLSIISNNPDATVIEATRGEGHTPGYHTADYYSLFSQLYRAIYKENSNTDSIRYLSPLRPGHKSHAQIMAHGEWHGMCHDAPGSGFPIQHTQILDSRPDENYCKNCELAEDIIAGKPSVMSSAFSERQSKIEYNLITLGLEVPEIIRRAVYWAAGRPGHFNVGPDFFIFGDPYRQDFRYPGPG